MCFVALFRLNLLFSSAWFTRKEWKQQQGRGLLRVFSFKVLNLPRPCEAHARAAGQFKYGRKSWLQTTDLCVSSLPLHLFHVPY